MNFSACIFDLDGTLLHTLEDITDALNAALGRFGLPPHDIGHVREMLGYGVRRLISEAISAAGGEMSVAEKVQETYTELYNEGCMRKTRPYPGIVELLQKLQSHGIQLMVLSNKSEHNSVQITAHYFPDIHFLSVNGGRPGRPLKPDPVVVHDLVDQFALDPSRTLFIGDSDVDVQTARNGGVRPVAVSWGYRDLAVLEGAGAEAIVDRPDQILGIV